MNHNYTLKGMLTSLPARRVGRLSLLLLLACCLLYPAVGQKPAAKKRSAQEPAAQQTAPPRQVEKQKVQVLKKDNTQIKVLPAMPGTLKGRITFPRGIVEQSGHSAQGWITVTGNSTLHDVKANGAYAGTYVVNELVPGTYKVEFHAYCWATQRKTVTIHPGETLTWDFRAVFHASPLCFSW